MNDFVNENRNSWLALAKKHGLLEDAIDRQGWGFTHFMLVNFDFDCQYDLSKLRQVRFSEEIKTPQGHFNARDA